jgi:hypothetical protein
MLKKTLLAGAMVLGMASSANAAVLGSVVGPDTTFFPITFEFLNTGPTDILSIVIDGSAVAPEALVWDSVGNGSGTTAAPVEAGENTTAMSFTWGLGGFLAGETFTLTEVDPDPQSNPSGGITVGGLIGTLVTVLFSDNTSFSGVFIDDPAPNAGLTLVDNNNPPDVPIPAALPLLAGGIVALGFLGRRSRRHWRVAA